MEADISPRKGAIQLVFPSLSDSITKLNSLKNENRKHYKILWLDGNLGSNVVCLQRLP